MSHLISNLRLESIRDNLNYLLCYLPKVELNAVNVFKIASSVTVGFVVIYCGKIWYSYRFFKKRGIKTPKIEFIHGNFRELQNNNYSDLIRSWTQQYGKVYGYYEGHLPVLVTSDLEIVQEIFIKQFSNFSARRRYAYQDSENSSMLFFSSNKWKRIRNIINPTFSALKLKQLIPLMRLSCERFINVIEKNLDKEVLVDEYFDSLALDMVFNCLMGLDIDCFNDKQNPFIVKTKQVFANFLSSDKFVIFCAYFPEFQTILTPLVMLYSYIMSIINNKYSDPFYWLNQNVKKLVQNRINKNIYRNDFVQILFEAISADDTTDKSSKLSSRKLNIDEIYINLVNFMSAGYDTTNTALVYAIYALSIYPNEANKIRDEIDLHFPAESNIEPSYDNLHQLEYLDLFIKEVLRMFPIANNVLSRRCTKATKLKGIDIPYDLTIAVDGLSLHFDPEIWGPEDPNEFHPLRFASDERKNSLAYLPFGIGPRNCVGYKFAILEMKLTLMKLVQNYDIVRTPNTPEQITYMEAMVRKSKFGIPVIFKKRS